MVMSFSETLQLKIHFFFFFFFFTYEFYLLFFFIDNFIVNTELCCNKKCYYVQTLCQHFSVYVFLCINQSY